MIDRRRLLAAGAATPALAAVGCATRPLPMLPPTVPAQPLAVSDPATAAAFATFMERTWNRVLDASPETVTGFGLDKGDRAAAKWLLSFPTLEDEEKNRQLTRSIRAELGQIDRSKLGGMDALRYDSVRTNYDAIIDTYAIPYGQGGWPAIYRVSQQGGSYQSMGDFLDSQHTIETADDAEAYVRRVDLWAEVLADETRRMQEDFARGVVPPDFILDTTIRQQEAMAAIAPTDSPIVASVVRRTQAKGLTGDWASLTTSLMRERVLPALAVQTEALKAARATAGHDASVRRLPQGEQYYANALHYITTTRLTADEIHRIGLEQVAELSARADELMRSQGMTEGTVGARLGAIADRPGQVYPNTDEAKAELIEELNGQMAAMQARLPTMFGRLPRSPVEIRRVPVEIQDGASLGYYNAPSLDGSRPGIYWINLKDTAAWPRFALPTLTYHEAAPGHHLQIALQQESPSAPLLMNTLFFSSYVEGWGLYAEQLADEMGAYDDDPLGRVGYLQSLMFRSVRLVVDTGIHSKGWSREQAIQYMDDHLGRAGDANRSEVDRYCGWPGQACAYKVGHNEWVRIRDKARRALGDRFDIRGFHDAGLETGGVPLNVLEQVIDDWVARQG